jgi:hypothetical protein
MTDTASIAWLGLDAHSQNCVLGHLADDGTLYYVNIRMPMKCAVLG